MTSATATAGSPARIVEASLAGLELAEVLGVDADRLTRLLRFADSRGRVRLDRSGRVQPTRLTPFLRKDHPGGWHA